MPREQKVFRYTSVRYTNHWLAGKRSGFKLHLATTQPSGRLYAPAARGLA